MKSCQQIRFVEILFSLRLYVEFVLQSRTLSSCSKSSMEYSEEESALRIRRRNPPCNVEDNLRVGLIVIEAWFRGY